MCLQDVDDRDARIEALTAKYTDELQLLQEQIASSRKVLTFTTHGIRAYRVILIYPHFSLFLLEMCLWLMNVFGVVQSLDDKDAALVTELSHLQNELEATRQVQHSLSGSLTSRYTHV